MPTLNDVKNFWDRASCGEVYSQGKDEREKYSSQAGTRYELEPYILTFAEFDLARGKDALEIGVGMGADHQRLAEAAPKTLHGVDLTERAIEHTKARLSAFGLHSELATANAESLPFADSSFDYVYSWGVIHHSPDTHQAAHEIYRVLRAGGRAKVMIYHRYSMVGYMLWTKYGLLAGKPLTSLDTIYRDHLESPGTKAYSVREATAMFSKFRVRKVESLLSFGDLLLGEVGQRHRGTLLTLAKTLYPRPVIRFAASHLHLGLYLLIDCEK